MNTNSLMKAPTFLNTLYIWHYIMILIISETMCLLSVSNVNALTILLWMRCVFTNFYETSLKQEFSLLHFSFKSKFPIYFCPSFFLSVVFLSMAVSTFVQTIMYCVLPKCSRLEENSYQGRIKVLNFLFRFDLWSEMGIKIKSQQNIFDTWINTYFGRNQNLSQVHTSERKHDISVSNQDSHRFIDKTILAKTLSTNDLHVFGIDVIESNCNVFGD